MKKNFFFKHFSKNNFIFSRENKKKFSHFEILNLSKKFSSIIKKRKKEKIFLILSFLPNCIENLVIFNACIITNSKFMPLEQATDIRVLNNLIRMLKTYNLNKQNK